MIRFNYRLLRFILLCYIILLTACQQQTTPTLHGTEATGLHPTDSAKLLFDRVDHYYKEVMHDSLYALAPVAMDYNREHGQWKEYYSTWCLLVNDLIWNGQMDKGFDEARKMHQDAIQRNNAFGLSEAYTAMGIAYHFQGNNKESINCYEQALEHYPADADQSVKLNIYSYYCQVLSDIRSYQTMGEVLQRWKEFLDELTGGRADNLEDIHRYFRFHRENYKYYFGQGDYQRAAKELDTMQAYLNKENDREVYEAQVAGLRMQLAMVRKDYNNAKTWSEHEIELSRHQDNNTFLNALKHRSDMLQQLGHYEEALKAWHDYDSQKDSIIKATNRDQLNELNKRFEVDELKAQQERSRLQHERGQLQLILIFAAIVVIALILFILFRQRAERRLKEAHKLLEQRNNELQESYEQLKTANARAEESSRMKTNFIRQISHEIRTPLNVLSGFTQVITTPGMELDDEEKMDISRRITDNTNRITGLVNKMLELSEANSQAVIKRNDEVLALEIANQAIDDSGITRARHLTFERQIDAGADSIKLVTNLRQASRALSQLLDNARKFTGKPEANGDIIVGSKIASVILSLTVNEDSIAFIVEDTGIGIPSDEAEHIFDEFVQLDEYYDGTGIGLTVARSIARRLGGDVTLDTTYNGGARFILALPR